MKNLAYAVIAFAFLLLLPAPLAQAQTSWKGTVSTDWSAAGNWTAGVPNSSLDAIVGDVNFTGPNQPSITGKSTCKSLTIGTGAKVSALTVNHAFTVSGSISIGANGTLIQATSRPISLAGNWNNLGTYTPNQNRATVTFSGTSQVISGTTAFNRIIINAGSRTTLGGNISVSNQLIVSGTLDPGDSPSFTVSGNAKLVVKNGGTLVVKAATFVANYGLNGAKNLAAGSTVDYASASVNQTVANNLTYGTLRISGGSTKTLAGNLLALNGTVATAGNLNVVAGTLDLAGFSADRSAGTTGGTVSVGNGATLKIGGTRSFPSNYQTHSLGAASTVEYSGSTQTVTAEAYGNLTLSSSGGAAVKTMPTTPMTIAGSLTSAVGGGTSVSFTAGAAISVQGNLSLGAATTFNGGSFAHSFGGNWINNGSFAGGTGSVTLAGGGAVVSGSGSNTFNDLNVTGSGVSALSSVNLAVGGNLTTSGAGTFTHLPGGAGTLTMSGASKTISGVGIVLNHLTIPGSITTASSFGVAGNLNVAGSLSATAGILTMTGSANTIAGGGTMTFYGLHLAGGISTTSSFSLRSDLVVSGSFTATAGAASFVGTSTLSGTANLFNVTLNGIRLQLGTGSVLGVAGGFAISAGTFDGATTTPNTVNYNAAGPQTILATVYDNLSCSGAGAKTAAGGLTVLGDLNIGSGTSLNAGSFTHSVSGNWVNQGSFISGSGTIQFAGSSSSSITGPTTFNTLTLNKASANTVVSLNDSINVTLLNMTNGVLLTGPNSVTITSTRTGSGIILGTITRTHAFAIGTPYAFESPNNTITFSNATSVTSVTVQVATGPVTDFPYGASVNREYAISLLAGGPYAAVLRLHYEDSELNGNLELALQLLRFGTSWAVSGVTAKDAANNWVEQNGLTDITGRWAISDNPKVVGWNGSVSTAWETAANWTPFAGSPSVPPGTNELVVLGITNFVNQPTINSAVAVRSLFFADAKPVNLTLAAGGSLTTSGNISGGWSSNAVHTIAVGNQTLNVGEDFQMSDGTNNHAINLSVGSGLATVAGNLTESGGASLTMTGAGTLRIGGDFVYSSGAFSAGTGTVTYNGSAAQQVAGGITYNNLAFTKTAGTANLTNAATVNGGLLLTNGGTFLVGANLTISNDVVVLSNTVLNGSSSLIWVGGNWTSAGTFVPGSGTVVFGGGRAQIIGASTFNNLTIDKLTNTAALAGNLVINGDLTVPAGTLDLGTFAATRSVVGGVLTLGPNAGLRIGAAFPGNFDATTLDAFSTVEFYGSIAQVVPGDTYGNLYFSNGGATAKTMAGDSSVTGNLVVNIGSSFNAATFSLNLQGNWTNNGTFVPSTGLVILAGTGKTLSGATAFNALSVPGSYTGVGDIAVAGTMNLTGTYGAGSSACTLAGDFLNNGTFTSSGTVTFADTALHTLALNGGFSSAGTVNFNGSTAPTFNSLAAPSFQNVNINNTGGVTPDIGWTVQVDLQVGSGALFNGGSATHIFNGNFNNQGTVTSAGTLIFNPSSAVNLLLGGPAFSAGSVVLGGTGPISFAAGAQPFNSIAVTNSYPTGVTPGGNWSLGGVLFIGPASILNGGVGLTHTIAGDLSDDGFFSGGTSLVIMTGSADPLNGGSIAGIGSTTFNHLTVAGLVGADANFNVSGNFTNNAAFDGTGSIVTFGGSSPSILGGSTSPTLFDALVVAKSAATTALAMDLTGLNALTVASGTLDIGAFAVAQNSLGGTLAVSSGGALRIGGANTLPVFATYAFDPAGIVEYYGALAQTISPANYGTLVSSSTGARTLPSGATIGISGSFVPGGNSYTTTGSTVDYNGTGSETIAPFNYFNLTSSSTGARTLPSSGTVGVSGSLTPGGNAYTITGSTVNFNGASQTIPAFTFNNLTLSGSGTKTAAGNLTTAGTLNLSAGTLADAGFTITAQANVINQAAHSGAGRILLTGAASSHFLSGGGAYNNLELNDPLGGQLVGTNLSVNGVLTLTAGLVNTSTNKVVIASSGSVTRTGGHVFGYLQKTVPTGATSRTFEIGDATSYAPVTVAFASVTTAGNLTAITTAGEYPGIAGSSIFPDLSVNRYWTLTNSGVAFNRYQATFNFNSTDVDPGASPSLFVLAVNTNGGWILPPVSSRSSTSLVATNLTTFGDYLIGVPAGPGRFTSIDILTNGNPFLSFTGNPGWQYRIQAATNLILPTFWTDISTNIADTNGAIQIQDTKGTNYPVRFYRSISP
jgi:fibronectin-binding autotransporter adhesin